MIFLFALTVPAARCYHTISTKAASNWPSYLGQWTGLYHTGQLCGAHTRGMCTVPKKYILPRLSRVGRRNRNIKYNVAFHS